MRNANDIFTGVAGYAADNPLVAAAAALPTTMIVLLAALLVWQAARHLTRTVRGITGNRRRSDDLLTLAVAVLVTGLSAQGMWRFFGDVLEMPPVLRVLMFGVFELAMLTSALRARRNIADPKIGTAGVDSAAVWVMAGLSGVLSALDADSFGGVLVRLAAPMVAAWLWERGMSIERRRSGHSAIHWRITPERVLVWLGAAEASDRTAGQVDAHRRLTRLARAAKQLRTLRAAGAKHGDLHKATRRLDKAMDAALAHAALTADPARQHALMALLGALYHAETLADLNPRPPWDTDPTEPMQIAVPESMALDRPRLLPVRADQPAGADTPDTVSAWSAPDMPSDTEPDTGHDEADARGGHRTGHPDMSGPANPDMGADTEADMSATRPGNPDTSGADRSRQRGRTHGRAESNNGDGDTDLEAAALVILAEHPDITGAELGRRLQVSDRHGRRLHNRLARRTSGPDDDAGNGPGADRSGPDTGPTPDIGPGAAADTPPGPPHVSATHEDVDLDARADTTPDASAAPGPDMSGLGGPGVSPDIADIHTNANGGAR